MSEKYYLSDTCGNSIEVTEEVYKAIKEFNLNENKHRNRQNSTATFESEKPFKSCIEGN